MSNITQLENEYKLLVMDLDGTLTNSRKEITPRTLHALMNAQHEGINIVLASGRPVWGILPVAQTLRLNEHDGWILAYNGGQIVNCRSGETLHAKVLNHSFFQKLAEESSSAGMTLMTYIGGEVWSENVDDKYVKHACMINKMSPRQVEQLPEALKGREVHKFLIVGEPELLHALEQKLVIELCDECNMFRSEDFFLEVVPKGIDKAASLDVLVKHLGMERKDVICCGDGYNDLSMIRYAGLGVAMGNAKEEVKQEADYVTLSNDKDGIAHLLDSLQV